MDHFRFSRVPGFFFLGWLILFAGCGGDVINKTDTPRTGKIRIGVDDSYKLLVNAELHVFDSLYNYTKITANFGSEADIINGFMQDSFPLIIVNRKLTPDEEKYLKARDIYPKTTWLGTDALALIVNNDNPESTISYDRISDIFNGKLVTWKQLDPKNSARDSIKIVFDNSKSGNTRYFREKFSLNKLPDCCFALKNNEEVITFVEKNKNAIGVIGVNWISDKSDKISHGFIKRIKVLNIRPPGNNDPGSTYYWPHPAYIAQGDYPFTRQVYCINRQTYMGLAYGFTSFFAGQKGQSIMENSGLTTRIVAIK
jgi:phosphate transport system substrate-binding protein